jgi:hypothetical protein
MDTLDTTTASISQFLELHSDPDRERYILDHTPQLLAALIVRRNSTDPEHLIELAVKTAGSLYDRLVPQLDTLSAD